MGRILDVLKRAEWPTPEPPPPSNPGAAAPAEDAETTAEEMPFIEVGGPGRKVEASPSLWVATTVLVPPPVQKPVLQPPPPRGAVLEPPPAVTVALHSALPAAPAAPRLAAEVIAYHQPDHAVSQQYRALLDQILTEVTGDGGRALLFTALTPGAGATTAVLNLAVCGAADPRRQVVVVDANLHRPTLARRLGVTAAPGLQEVLAGTAALEQVIQKTVQERLHALPAGAGPGRLALLNEAAVSWLLGGLRERYDLVVVDGAPWQNNGELGDLAAGVDAVYLVIDEGQAGQPAVRAATRGLAQYGARLGGLVVTK